MLFSNLGSARFGSRNEPLLRGQGKDIMMKMRAECKNDD